MSSGAYTTPRDTATAAAIATRTSNFSAASSPSPQDIASAPTTSLTCSGKKKKNYPVLRTNRTILIFQAPNLAPPAPPARNSSMRNGSTASLMSKLLFENKLFQKIKFSLGELEARLPFHNVREFPDPQPFRSVVKQYSSRTPANGLFLEKFG